MAMLLYFSVILLFCGIHGAVLDRVVDDFEAVRSYGDPFISSAEYNGKVFLFPYDDALRKGDFFFNEGYCREHNAEMVSLHSAEENKFFYRFISRLGTPFGNFHPGVWLGATIENKSKTFVWKDGSPVNYYNWSPYDPNEPNFTCLLTGWKDIGDQWGDYYCSEKTVLVACQRKVRTPSL